ncbi:MAG: hypothetical protein WBA93_32800 [Microcoleaceae cyanobacterium]
MKNLFVYFAVVDISRSLSNLYEEKSRKSRFRVRRCEAIATGKNPKKIVGQTIAYPTTLH